MGVNYFGIQVIVSGGLRGVVLAIDSLKTLQQQAAASAVNSIYKLRFESMHYYVQCM